MDQAGGALLASLFWGAFTVGRLAGIPLSVRFSPEKVLQISRRYYLPIVNVLTEHV